jgi:hypothetical protein
MNNVIILDDVISKDYQDYLENLLLHNMDMTWHLIRDLDHAKDDQTEFISVGFSIQAISDHTDHGMLAFIFKSLAYAIAEKLDVKIKKFINARTFLQVPNNLKNSFSYHVDYAKPHTVLLYYVNDSDGETVILKQKYPFSHNKCYGLTTGEVLQKIEPKKGRVVMFNGSHFHSASVPTKSLRCVINIDVDLADFTNKLN